MKFLIGFIVGLILLPVFAFLYLELGYAPVATSAPALPMERTITGMALNAAIKKQAPSKAPIEPTEANLLSGAKLYREHCAVCHGLSDGQKTAIAKGMFPRPPLLLHGKGVTDDPAGESYWKIANGIRLTGMPAFHDSLQDEQLWQLSLLVATADKLPASVTQVLAEPVAMK